MPTNATEPGFQIGDIVVSESQDAPLEEGVESEPDVVGELSMLGQGGDAYITESSGITNVVAASTLRRATEGERSQFAR